MSTSMQGQKARADGSSPPKQWNWIRLLRNVVVGGLVLVVFYVAIGEADVGIPVAVLLLPALFWLRRQSRGAAIYSGIACGFIGLVVLLVFGSLFQLAYPTSWPMFISASVLLVLTVLGVTATVGAVRRGTSATAAPRRLARLGAGAILACVVFGVAAGLTVKSDTRQPGDVVLTITPSVESSPRSLTVDAGRVSILVRNQSNFRNTLTIDGVVTREVPARSTKRVTFTVAPGDYRFYSESAADDTAGRMIAR